MFVISPAKEPHSEHNVAIPDFALGSFLRAIQDQGFIRVAVLDDLPGFAFKNPDTGARSGLDIGVARVLTQGIFGGPLTVANEHIEFIDIAAPQRELICREDGADFVISAFGISEARRKNVDFTDSYHGTPLSFMGRSNEPEPDLSKATFAVVEASNCHAYVKRYSLGAKTFTFPNTSQLPASVASGESDVAVIMGTVLDEFVKAGTFPIQRLRQSLMFETWGVGVRKGNDQLRDFLNQQLRVLRDDGVVIAAAGINASS